MATSGSGSSKRNRILELIALFRLAKALLLILAGFGALELLRPGMAERVRDWLASLPFAAAHEVKELIKKVTAVRAGVLAANIAIVAYLVALRRQNRLGRGAR